MCIYIYIIYSEYYRCDYSLWMERFAEWLCRSSVEFYVSSNIWYGTMVNGWKEPFVKVQMIQCICLQVKCLMLSSLNGAICGMVCWVPPDLTPSKIKQEAGLIENPNIFHPSFLREVWNKKLRIFQPFLKSKFNLFSYLTFCKRKLEVGLIETPNIFRPSFKTWWDLRQYTLNYFMYNCEVTELIVKPFGKRRWGEAS